MQILLHYRQHPPCHRWEGFRFTAIIRRRRIFLERIPIGWFKNRVSFTRQILNPPRKHFFLPSLIFIGSIKTFTPSYIRQGWQSLCRKPTLNTIQITSEMLNLEANMKSFWAYGSIWMIEWIKRGMPESGDELSRLFALVGQWCHMVLVWFCFEVNPALGMIIRIAKQLLIRQSFPWHFTVHEH